MMQITLRLKPAWFLTKLTSEYPSVTISIWCNFRIDFYQFRSAKADELRSASQAFLAMIRKKGLVLQRRMKTGAETVVFTLACGDLRPGSVEETMHDFNCLALHPFVCRGGWARINAVCFDEDLLPVMLSRLSKMAELEVASKVKLSLDLLLENFMVPSNTLVSKLTAKQAQSLLTAVEFGYYQVPRRVTFEYISKVTQTPRTTYEEHVRKAESKIINAVAPYLSLFFANSAGNRKEKPHSSRNSSLERTASLA